VRKILILIGAAALVTVGCGSGSSSTTASASNGSGTQPVSLPGTTNDHGTKSPSGNEIEVEMDDFYFNPTFVKGTPGQTLTVHLKNEGKNAHTFTSSALGVDKTVQPEQTADVQVTLPQSGASEYHCSFHQGSGMQGAFFFNTGDTIGSGTPGASPSGAGTSSTSSSSTSLGGYDYN
jgi:plastocyanin